jgi:AbrB family looped-hinge helix DNA binding protein
MGDGIINGMKSTMDSAGRLVIPKDIRKEAGIRPGMPLDVRVRDGRIEIEPAPLVVRLEKRGRFLVAVPEKEVPVLTSETVELTRKKIRREREGK